MTGDTTRSQHWTARHCPNPPVAIPDQATARAQVPDADGDPYTDGYAWYWRTATGTIIAVTKQAGSVHIATQPFATLREAATDFHAYWPHGLFWEEQGARDWMDHLARKYPSGDEPRYQPPSRLSPAPQPAEPPAPQDPPSYPSTDVPQGLFWEERGARHWMNYLDSKRQPPASGQPPTLVN